jgi:hypothetical protein
MTAEGYQSAPLSDELELRIRQRLQQYRDCVEEAITDGAVTALEWVLNEAEVLKVETVSTQTMCSADIGKVSPIRIERRDRRPLDETCPRCGHIHQGDSECGEQMGGGRICRCELSVPA